MIIEKVLGNLSSYPQDRRIDALKLEWFELDRKILRKFSSEGEDVGLRVKDPLRDGDVLFDDGHKVIAIELAPCQIIRVRASTKKEMGEICLALGNRHIPASISEDSAVAPFDSPAFDYLSSMGFNCEKAFEKFTGSKSRHAHD
ncbi:MAG: urease accessory protein UreE [Clostridiales bacterium]|jgi:urease accessory protein|nr:urease accessory protein UreE [Clostridiales bacterium]